MPKSRNMGRASHMAQDNEIDEEQPAAEAARLQNQPTRATQHPRQGTKASGERPLRRHSRRGQ